MDEGEKFGIFFLTPTEEATKPCDHFLLGSCKFGDQCRYSHGHIIPAPYLRPFDPTISTSTLKEGQDCYVKYSDGLWYPAVVEEIIQMEGELIYQMVFRDFEETTKVSRTDIVLMLEPYEDSDEESNFEEEEEEDEEGDSSFEMGAYGRLKVGEVEMDEDFKQAMKRLEGGIGEIKRGYKIGDWEKYTTGIGSKLLMKMGYKFVSYSYFS